MTPQEMLEQMIDSATIEFLEIAKEEEEGDYSDAMLSMERTEASGLLEGLNAAYEIIFNKTYTSTADLVNISE
jgi:hypothetical protein